MDKTGDDILDVIRRAMPNLRISKETLIKAIDNKRLIADQEAGQIGEENYQNK
jgi:hypothetical protein